jgi:hypothetical protein
VFLEADGSLTPDTSLLALPAPNAAAQVPAE